MESEWICFAGPCDALYDGMGSLETSAGLVVAVDLVSRYRASLGWRLASWLSLGTRIGLLYADRSTDECWERSPLFGKRTRVSDGRCLGKRCNGQISPVGKIRTAGKVNVPPTVHLRQRYHAEDIECRAQGISKCPTRVTHDRMEMHRPTGTKGVNILRSRYSHLDEARRPNMCMRLRLDSDNTASVMMASPGCGDTDGSSQSGIIHLMSSVDRTCLPAAVAYARHGAIRHRSPSPFELREGRSVGKRRKVVLRCSAPSRSGCIGTTCRRAIESRQ
ncbi:uncharacterized protein EV422DRAFT_335922 [Fimicolochytrium jonesii]|uniref:uncharacterized protein n=1 Tax=Fimicolochytrium jonesii TaxID=1396493 RepID=UPI0022FE18E8|nr:uncharacterized protein EV422DRAFT_335922 [Fimicolochytrium jonesii]KAI8815918.1 hypothetical protein EV422DRAFT_335922 [Fimicolochytrium jonesii]